MQQRWGMKALDKRSFTRHLHRLPETLKTLFLALGQHLKQLNTQARFVIDSFLVAVCDNGRIKLVLRDIQPAQNSKLRPYREFLFFLFRYP